MQELFVLNSGTGSQYILYTNLISNISGNFCSIRAEYKAKIIEDGSNVIYDDYLFYQDTFTPFVLNYQFFLDDIPEVSSFEFSYFFDDVAIEQYLSFTIDGVQSQVDLNIIPYAFTDSEYSFIFTYDDYSVSNKINEVKAIQDRVDEIISEGQVFSNIFDVMIEGTRPVVHLMAQPIAPNLTIGMVSLIPVSFAISAFLLKGLIL